MSSASSVAERFTHELLKSRLSILLDDSLSLSRPAGRNWCKEHSLIRTSVVVPFSIINGDVHIMFVKRSDKVWAAKGEISFPGGIIQEEDADEVDGGLRELEEEVGLTRDKLSFLGTFKPTLGTVWATDGKPTDLLMYFVLVYVHAEFSPILNYEIADCWWYPLNDFTDYSKVKSTPMLYRGLDFMFMSRSITNKGCAYDMQYMPILCSTLTAIVVHNCQEPFLFGSGLLGNCYNAKKILDAIVHIPVENIHKREETFKPKL